MGTKAKSEPQKRERPLPVRLPEGMREQLDAAAARIGISRNALIVRSLERTLGMAHIEAETPKPDVTECRHPKAGLLVLAYGTFCKACSQRVR